MIKKLLFILSFFLINGLYSQDIIINEFCSLNTSVFDDDNDTPDWIEIFNPTANAVNLGEYYFSDDSTILTKWNFPNIELNPETYMLVFASGKDRKEQNFLTNLINQGDTFQYSIGSEDIATDWKTTVLLDSSWLVGASGFGYGDDDDETLFDEGVISVFVRKSFTIDDIEQIKKILLHIDYDDGFVAYINGIEVARANLGTAGTDVPYNQEADTYVEPVIKDGIAPELFEFEEFSSFLNNGENILAIQIHNNSPTSSDMTLIPFLSVETYSPLSGNAMPEVLRMPALALHTNFKITSDGEEVFLTNSSGELVDKTDSIALPSGVSYGRSINNMNSWLFYDKTTPGAENSTKGYRFLGNSIVSFAPVGGKYGSSEQVRLSSYAGGSIHYTTDGSTPGASSMKYEGPIEIDKTTVVKAIVYSEDVLPVSPSVETYIVDSRSFKLPVISLSSDPDNFFDWNTGILVDGPNASSDFPHFGANFWEDWERPVYIEYYNQFGEKQFEAAGGTKVFGGWSRGMDQKSLSLFARKAYGVKTFDYKFFEERKNDKFKSLVLRNSGNDSDLSHMRDGMMTGLVRDIDIDRQAFQPTIVYINGEYWGILNLREKINEDFLAQNHDGVDPDRVDILERDGWGVVEGSYEHYRDMISYIEDNGLSENDDYQYVSSMMNVDNFMDYQIAQIYFDNKDWPGNNIKFWRPQRENARWRWILYDTDFGFSIGFGDGGSGYTVNTLRFALDPNGPSWPNPPWSTFLLRSFVDNEQFVKEFSNRFADRLNHDFEADRVSDFINSIKSEIRSEVSYHSDRWNNLWDFSDEISKFHEFAEERPDYMRIFLRNEFELGDIVDLEVNVDNADHGRIQVNTLYIENYPWAGKYFEDNPVPVAAIAEPGYEFSHWEGIESSSAYINLSVPADGLSIKAIFKVSEKTYNSVVINEIKYMSSEAKNSSDWLELFNTSNVPFDISGWKITDTDLANAYEFPKGSVIEGKGYLVVCEDLDNFSEQNPDVKNVVGNLGFGLNSSYDMLWLVDENSVTIDSIHYYNDAPWPSVPEDHTISLYTPYSDNNLGSNWLGSMGEGTPGEHNDHFTDIQPEKSITVDAKISVYPNPVDTDVTIFLNNEKSQKISIDLYDLKGSKLSSLYSGYCTKGSKQFDITVNRSIPAGLYLVNVMFESGEKQTAKLVKM